MYVLVCRPHDSRTWSLSEYKQQFFALSWPSVCPVEFRWQLMAAYYEWSRYCLVERKQSHYCVAEMVGKR